MKTDISIILPVKDEEKNIFGLAREIDEAMENVKHSWECLWVDDGSTDSTLDHLISLHHNRPCHRYLSLTQNFGQSAAMAAGFRHSAGKILVTLDGDGQNDPSDIPALIDRLISANADMVNGWRQKREDSLIRKVSSRIANAYRNKLTRENIRDVGCSLRAFKKECVENIPVFKGMHRFIPTLARIAGHERIIEMPVHHRPRKHGLTKYGINNRLWVGIADTFAVYWMQRRLVYPKVAQQVPTEDNR